MKVSLISAGIFRKGTNGRHRPGLCRTELRITLEKESKFIKRVRKDMTAALLDELTKKPFEQITIADICLAADYPRSTFYKYYYDKLDLFSDYLHEQWQAAGIKDDDAPSVIFAKIEQYFRNDETMNAILANNRTSPLFHDSLHDCLAAELQGNSYISTDSIKEAPRDMIVDFFFNILVLFARYRTCLSHDQAISMADHLLAPIG